MREARFVMGSMLYHLLPIGINFSIDKLADYGMFSKDTILSNKNKDSNIHMI